MVSGDYDRATGSHQQSDLSVTALAGSTFDDLNLTTLVTRPGYFTEPPGSTTAPTGPVPQTVAGGGQHAWYVGSPRRLTGVSVQVRGDPGCPLPPGGLGLGLLTASGGTRPAPPLTPVSNGPGTAAVALDGATTAVGIVVTNVSACPLTVDSASVTTAGSGVLVLAGPLQGVVTAPKMAVRGDPRQLRGVPQHRSQGTVLGHRGGRRARPRSLGAGHRRPPDGKPDRRRHHTPTCTGRAERRHRSRVVGHGASDAARGLRRVTWQCRRAAPWCSRCRCRQGRRW